jgi:hypothetical protein
MAENLASTRHKHPPRILHHPDAIAVPSIDIARGVDVSKQSVIKRLPTCQPRPNSVSAAGSEETLVQTSRYPASSLAGTASNSARSASHRLTLYSVHATWNLFGMGVYGRHRMVKYQVRFHARSVESTVAQVPAGRWNSQPGALREVPFALVHAA